MPAKQRVMDDSALDWANRGVWVLCIAVYLTVFVGGVMAGGDELLAMGRGVGFTLAAGVLGKIGVGLLGRASLPDEQGPLADDSGPVGSLVDQAASTNVAEQEDRAEAA